MAGRRKQAEGRRKSRAKRNDTQPDAENIRTLKIDGPPPKLLVFFADGESLQLNTVVQFGIQQLKQFVIPPLSKA